jgi:hypothetical protein
MARRALISKVLLAAISPLAILVALEFALGFAAVDRPLLHFAKPNEYREDSELIYAFLPSLEHRGDYRFCTYYNLSRSILGPRANQHIEVLLAELRESGAPGRRHSSRSPA